MALSLAIAPAAVNAQGMSKYEQKEAKKQAKMYEKKGWSIQGTSSIEAKLLEMRQAELNGDIILTGAALDGFSNNNNALTAAREAAVNEYAELTGNSIIKGRIASETANMSGEESNNLVSMAENNFLKELNGQLGIPKLKIEKGDSKEGTYQIMCWWALSQARMDKIYEQAIQKSMGDVDNASKLGDKISKFVNGGSN